MISIRCCISWILSITIIHKNIQIRSFAQLFTFKFVKLKIRFTRMLESAVKIPKYTLRTKQIQLGDPTTKRIRRIHCLVFDRVWGLKVLGMDCGDEAARWFQTFLQAEGVRLVVSSGSMPKKDSSKMLKPWGNPAQPGDLVMPNR